VRRAIVVGGGLTLLFFAFITGNRVAFAMVYMVVGLTAAAWTWTYLGWRGLRLQRGGLGGVYQVGEKYAERVEAHNGSRLSLPWLEFIDHSRIPGYSAGRLLSLGPRSRRRWRAEGCFELRGRYQLGPAELVAGDPFGFFRRSIRVAAAEIVTVYPRLVDVGRMLPGATHAVGDTIASGRHADAPPDAYGIRAHDPEDGFSRIHWPSTARLGQPMSKVFEKFEGSRLMVLLDLERSVHRGSGAVSTLEYAVSLAASVAVEVINRGQPVGMACNDRRRSRVEAGTGSDHLRLILDLLAEAEADGSAPLDTLVASTFAAQRAHHTLVITPNPDLGWIERLVDADRRSGQRSTVFYLHGPTFASGPPALARRGRQLTAARPRSYADDRLVWWQFEAGDEIFG